MYGGPCQGCKFLYCPGALNSKQIADLQATGLTPVAEINSHPFVFGRFTIAHNGTVAAFFEIKTALLTLIGPAARHKILGTTDTEHVAGLFFTHLDEQGPWTRSYTIDEMKTALRKTFEDLHTLIEKVRAPGQEHSFLNLIITDGASLVHNFLKNRLSNVVLQVNRCLRLDTHIQQGQSLLRFVSLVS